MGKQIIPYKYLFLKRILKNALFLFIPCSHHSYINHKHTCSIINSFRNIFKQRPDLFTQLTLAKPSVCAITLNLLLYMIVHQHYPLCLALEVDVVKGLIAF